MTNRWYYGGIRNLTSTFEETLDLLENLIRRIDPALCCTVGASGGGYMALAAAAMLGLDRSLALSPQTNLSEDWRLSHNDARWEDSSVALHQTLRGRLPYDVKDLIATSAAKSEFHVLYTNGEELDALHADRLEECRNTFLYGLEMSEQNSASGLFRIGRLGALLNRFVSHDTGSLHAALCDVLKLRPNRLIAQQGVPRLSNVA